jgi:hypothetical protein
MRIEILSPFVNAFNFGIEFFWNEACENGQRKRCIPQTLIERAVLSIPNRLRHE